MCPRVVDDGWNFYANHCGKLDICERADELNVNAKFICIAILSARKGHEKIRASSISLIYYLLMDMLLQPCSSLENLQCMHTNDVRSSS